MRHQLTIGWLYPELMSTYGDRGNITVLTKRCQWREIGAEVLNIDFSTRPQLIAKCDLIFGGGAQDRQQAILIDDLREKKGNVLKSLFDRGVPGLFVCGAPQLLGHSYMTGDGRTLKGLGIFDMMSRNFGKDQKRCIGNLVCELSPWLAEPGGWSKKTIVGFENHGGRTYLNSKNLNEASKIKIFARVLKGSGNNGDDGTEGAVYNNCIATYSHGPFLPKNPHIADWLIIKALEVKYNTGIKLQSLDDSLEWRAHDFVLKKYG